MAKAATDTRDARRAGNPKTTGGLEPKAGRCGGKLSYTGTSETNPARYCLKWPLKGGNGRCKRHGGKALKGAASHSYKDGRTLARTYAKNWVPAPIKDDFEAILASDQLLSLSHQIARQKAYELELERRTEDGAIVAQETFKAIQVVVDAAQRFDGARKQKNKHFLVLAVTNLMESIGKLKEASLPAISEAASRKELRETKVVLTQLTRVEMASRESLYNMITAEHARAQRDFESKAFFDAMERYVPDPTAKIAIRRFISERFGELLTRRSASTLDATGRISEASSVDPPPDD